MAEYKGIKGFKVQSLASDPTADEGQIWYNTTSSALKYDAVAAGAWSSGGNINNTRADGQGAGASSSSGLYIAGQPSTYAQQLEEYDGTSWTVSPQSLGTNHWNGTASGTKASAIMISGNPGPTVNCEIWDGSTWTETGNVTTGRNNAYTSIAGPVTATLVATGNNPPTLNVELFNGTAWTESTNVNEGKRGGEGAGTQTDCLIWSGYPSAYGTEKWNGTSWTELTDMGTSRYHFGSLGATSTAAIGAGGTYPPGNRLTIVESWNGSSWTEIADLSSEREGQGAAGTAVTGYVVSGLGPAGAGTNVCEEWDGAPAVVKTVTVS